MQASSYTRRPGNLVSALLLVSMAVTGPVPLATVWAQQASPQQDVRLVPVNGPDGSVAVGQAVRFESRVPASANAPPRASGPIDGERPGAGRHADAGTLAGRLHHLHEQAAGLGRQLDHGRRSRIPLHSILGAGGSGAAVVPELGPCLRAGRADVPLVRRRPHQSCPQCSRSTRRRGERWARSARVPQRARRACRTYLRPTPARSEAPRGRPAWPRRRERRPRHPFHADLSRSGHLDAGVCPNRRHSLGHLRGVRRASACGSDLRQRLARRVYGRCDLSQG